MMGEAPKLPVFLSRHALATLDQIWAWNAERYNPEHADRYLAFLRSEAEKLATDYLAGKAVPTRPAMRYITIQRRRKGHGHVAVYEVIADAVHVLDFFHTAQDWPRRL